MNKIVSTSLEVEELQHRSANMLQLILGVTRFQARRSTTAEARERLAAVQDFVLTMAELNRTLAGIGRADLEQALAAATRHWQPLARAQDVTIAFRADNPPAMGRSAVERLVLVLQEAVTNALEHGFAGDMPGDIEVVVTGDHEEGVLLISDNGVGLPQGWSPAESGVGTRLVSEMAASLGGRAEWTSVPSGGTCLKVTFRAEVGRGEAQGRGNQLSGQQAPARRLPRGDGS